MLPMLPLTIGLSPMAVTTLAIALLCWSLVHGLVRLLPSLSCLCTECKRSAVEAAVRLRCRCVCCGSHCRCCRCVVCICLNV